MSGIRKATDADRDAVSQSLGSALRDDPVLRWLFPHRPRRHRVTNEFFDWTLRTVSEPLDEVWCTEDLSAAALWAPPDRWRLGIRDQLKLLPRATSLFRARTPRILVGFNQVEARHPPQPHWYLYFIGTRPDQQGRGLGSALLAPMLALADEQGCHVYTEASTPRVVPFYARHGFATTEEFTVRGGPTWTLMLRDPR